MYTWGWGGGIVSSCLQISQFKHLVKNLGAQMKLYIYFSLLLCMCVNVFGSCTIIMTLQHQPQRFMASNQHQMLNYLPTLVLRSFMQGVLFCAIHSQERLEWLKLVSYRFKPFLKIEVAICLTLSNKDQSIWYRNYT